MRRLLIIVFLITISNIFAQNNSQFISQIVPTSVNTSETFSVSVTFTNTGTTLWDSNYSLGSQNPQDNNTWGITRIYLVSDVAVGATVTFTTSITAPSTPGIYDFQWRVLESGVEWFGDWTPNIKIKVMGTGYQAAFLTQSVPGYLNQNENFNTTIEFVNVGSVTWDASNGFSIGSQAPQDNNTWGVNRINLLNDVAPGDTAVISTILTAPGVDGLYEFCWRMVDDIGSGGWFGDYSDTVLVGVNVPYNVVADASTLGGDCYNLISGNTSMKGAIWYNDKINLNNPFDIYFTVNFSNPNLSVNPADGVMFVLQTAGNNVVGGSGAALGYAGFFPSLGVEIDVYSNSPGQLQGYPELGNEVTSEGGSVNNSIDHMAISDNGTVNCRIANPVALINPDDGTNDIVDGQDRIIRITWDPADDSIKVWFDCQLVIETQWDIINNSMNGENMVYWGFTGSSGTVNTLLPKICLDANIMKATETKDICYGDSAQLYSKAYGTSTPVWTSIPTSSNIDLTDPKKPIVWPDTTTIYYVTYDLPCNNGSQTDSVLVNVKRPFASLTGGGDICDDGSTSDLYLEFTGDAPWAYDWSLDGTPLSQGITYSNDTISVLNGGTYLFTNVIDSMGCVAEYINQGTIVTVNPLPTPNITGILEFCDGLSTTLDAGAFPTYLWNTGDVSQTVIVNTADEYIVTVTDANSCSNSDTAQVIMHNLPNAIVSVSPNTTICKGDTINIDASSSTGTGTLNFNWSNSATTSTTDVWPNANITYIVSVTDDYCTDTESIDIIVNSLPVANAGNVDPTICNGQTVLLNANGSIPGSGNTTLTYSWSNLANTDTTSVSPTTDNMFIVTVTNESSCSDIDTVEVFVNQLPVINLTPANNTEICNGETILLDASATTGTGTLTYSWSSLSDSTTTLVNPTNDSIFYLTVTDVNTCENYGNIQIIVNQLPNFAPPTIVDLTNCITHNGEITLFGENGTPWSTGYQFNINGSAFNTTYNWDTLNSIVYTYGIIDSVGCVFYQDFTIPNSMGTAVDSVEYSEIMCYGDTTSTITVYAQGSNIDYSIDNGSTVSANNTFNNNGAGSYQIYIIDNSTNCEAGDTITIPEPTALTNYFTEYNIKCFGDNSGSVVANYSGGTPVYTITGDFPTDSISNLYANTTYYITIKDNNNCVLEDSIILSQPTELQIDNIYKSDLLCYNDNTGEITIEVTGGVSSIINPYIYQWTSTTLTDSIISNLSAGWYYFIVTDNNLCSKNDSIEVLQPDSLILTPFSQNTICDTSNGMAVVTITGGTPNYSYLWNSSVIDNDTLSGLTAGNYTVVVTDINLCEDSVDFVINDQSTGLLNVSNIENVDCYGDSTASIYVNINGGTANYTYNWYSETTLLTSETSVNTTGSIQNLPEGYYTIIVTDSMNCSTSINDIYISENSEINISYNITDILCYNNANGSISTSVTGGVLPYFYLWSTNDTTSVIENLSSGYYAILISDSLDCKAITDSIFIANPTDLILDTLSTSNLTCFESNDGEIIFEVNGGKPNYTYFIDSVEVFNTSINDLSAGIHLIYSIDSNNCVVRDTFTLVQPNELVIIDSIYNNNNIYVQAIGGTPNYYYNWEQGETEQTLTELPTGTYVLTVTDANNCETVGIYRVEEPLLIPTVITPNADDYNDTWKVKGLLGYDKINIHIFNRWGDVIYEFEGTGMKYNDETIRWDGMWNGKELPFGTYVYIIEIKDINESYNGTVTIVR